MFRADLHCHSTCSDGSLTPVELVELAKKQNLTGLSITDHDTIEAYDTAVEAARDLGILLGTGVELSSEFQKMSVHILGYNYSLDSELMRDFCRKHKERRRHRNLAILAKLARLNMVIKEEELPGRSIGRPHIAQKMVEKGYVKSAKEAFNLFIGEGKCCYDPGIAFSVPETLDVIHRSGGKAFVAHPHLFANGAKMRLLLGEPFDGLECYYAHSYPALEKRWLKIAKEKQWLISGGSDFHGDMRPGIPLGCSWVDEETFHKIFSP